MKLIPTPYNPWWAQRLFHRSRAPIRTIVAARQIGKSHCAAEEVVKICCARPGCESVLLVPTYKSAEGTLRHLKRALVPLRGRFVWREQRKVFIFWNGHKLYVRTEDGAKDGVPTRGLTLDGVLWVDEAAYIARKTWEAARLTQAAVKDPLAILTSTPRGKNWLYEEWHGKDGANTPGNYKPGDMNESFRFRTSDSPFVNQEFIADMRLKLGAQKAMQELDAEFLGDAGSAFKKDAIDRMLSQALVVRGEQRTLGIDLAKEVDYTVITLMNELGEAWILARFKNVDWPDVEKRILGVQKAHNALIVLDVGHGGGYGGAMKDYLERTLGKNKILCVKTGNLGVKAEVCETLIKDVENQRIVVDNTRFKDSLRHEMVFFESHREVVGGVERMRYHGPEGRGDDDHDDCVISLALANWGRIHGWDGFKPADVDWSQYLAQGQGTSNNGNRGYRFRLPGR